MTLANDVTRLSQPETAALLSKLIVGKHTVKAVFTGIHHLSVAFDGVIYPGPERSVVVRSVKKMPGSYLRFDPTAAASVEYGGVQGLPRKQLDRRLILSTLTFTYLDQTKLTLFELTPE